MLADVGWWKEVLKLNFRQYGQMEEQSQEEDQAWRKSEGRRSERETVRREKPQVREKVGKSRATLCFSNVLWLGRGEK